MRARRRRARGVGMVEFALVLPVFLVVLSATVDMARGITTFWTVADAARQGARQAAAAAVGADSPFAVVNGQPCSGVVFTQNASGTGCLTDQAILATVTHVLGGAATAVTLRTSTTAASCGTTAATRPPAGQALVCVAPAQSGVGPPAAGDNTCPSVNAAASYPFSQVGDRQTEWSNQFLRGCYLIQVTVRLSFTPWTPLMGSTVQLVSSTSTVAEY